MEASPVNIIQYFDGSKQGLIPLFQRPYSWESKDWDTLWEDIFSQYDPEDRTSHFMGAIVTVPVKSVPVGVTKHLVIDGQQRLTTLSLLLMAIRKRAIVEGDNPTEGIISDLLINRHYRDPDDLKLVPTQADRSAYKALVYKRDIQTFQESRIVQAFRFFEKKLGGLDTNDAPINASKTLQAIQQSLQVVMINLGEADDPYLIFESLNHKGKPLNQADLVRNYVLMRFQHSTAAGGEQEIAYEDLWRPMETRLNGKMTEFLRHFGMRKGKNVRKGDIYTASKSELDGLKSVEDVRSKLVEMKSAAMSYEKFIKPSEEFDERISHRLQGIQDLDSTVFYPLLLRVFQLKDSNVIKQEDIIHFLDMLESFYVRRLVCAVPTNALNKITLELCLGLPETNSIPWLVEKLLTGTGNRRFPTNDEFSASIITEKIYPRRRIARYMLIALEESFDHKECVDSTTATIEHIMPQTLTDNWIEMLGPDYRGIHDAWLDTLGNLTLTGYNAELGNDTFLEKLLKLKNTHFELTRDILNETSWGPTQIEERAKRLANMAIQRWISK